MTRLRALAFLAVVVGLLGSAAALYGHEPAGADNVYRHRVACRAVCVEAR